MRHLQRCGLAAMVMAGTVWHAGSAEVKLDFLTAGSQVYSNVTVLRSTATDLYFRYEGGIKNVKLRYLTPELQKQFGYDPKVAEAAEQHLSQYDAAQPATGANATPATKPRSTEDNLLDPISDRSILGKPVPALAAEGWLGTAPNLKGRCVIYAFLASWSFPSRKLVPDLNGLSRQYSEKMVVVGVAPEDSQGWRALTEPRMEFPCALDPKGQFCAALGVTAVPQVVVVDHKGIVHYQGHPSGLTERKLQALLASTAQ